MGVDLGHGLEGFARERIGLRDATGAYTRTIVRGCSVHHGGDVGAPRASFESAAATLREWQRYHLSKGWIDLGYTLAMDGLGRLYEGRPVGALPAAVGNHNTGTIALVFLQDGRRYGLTPRQRASLRVLFEHGAKPWRVPPLQRLDVRVHREYAGHESNACPGARIERHVAWRRGRYE